MHFILKWIQLLSFLTSTRTFLCHLCRWLHSFGSSLLSYQQTTIIHNTHFFRLDGWQCFIHTFRGGYFYDTWLFFNFYEVFSNNYFSLETSEFFPSKFSKTSIPLKVYSSILFSRSCWEFCTHSTSPLTAQLFLQILEVYPAFASSSHDIFYYSIFSCSSSVLLFFLGLECKEQDFLVLLRLQFVLAHSLNDLVACAQWIILTWCSGSTYPS